MAMGETALIPFVPTRKLQRRFASIFLPYLKHSHFFWDLIHYSFDVDSNTLLNSWYVSLSIYKSFEFSNPIQLWEWDFLLCIWENHLWPEQLAVENWTGREVDAGVRSCQRLSTYWTLHCLRRGSIGHSHFRPRLVGKLRTISNYNLHWIHTRGFSIKSLHLCLLNTIQFSLKFLLILRWFCFPDRIANRSCVINQFFPDNKIYTCYLLF